MVRYLQKRRFRLATRWKQALRRPEDLYRPKTSPIKNVLIFRAFDDLLRELKSPSASSPLENARDYSPPLAADIGADAGQFVEFFLAGRKILGDFINHDPAFLARFDPKSREELQTACDRALMHFIDRELTEQELRKLATQKPGNA